MANVALTTDVYSCGIQDEDQRELLKRLDKKRGSYLKIIFLIFKFYSACTVRASPNVKACEICHLFHHNLYKVFRKLSYDYRLIELRIEIVSKFDLASDSYNNNLVRFTFFDQLTFLN